MLVFKLEKQPASSKRRAVFKFILCERILSGVEVTLREVVVNLLNGNTHILHDLPEVLTSVIEHHSSVVRIVLLDEDVTLEAAHVLDTKDTNRTE